jgi:DNA sulfur modification protein DndD
MRLKRIEIENFGIYKDKCIFDLEYNPEKRVTLLIGENGSGKTTLLNSIKTGLYGSMLFGAKSLTPKYTSYLNSHFNKDARDKANSIYAIEITFISNFQKFNGQYTIRRTWNLHGDIIKESIALMKNEFIVDDIERDEFFNAFFRFYPSELFDMFYLDGEKIDQMSVLNSNIYRLIESAMNIDLFKHLRMDLETLAIRKNNDTYLDELETHKKMLITSLEDLKESNQNYQQEIDELKSEESTLAEQIGEQIKKISAVDMDLPEKVKNYSEMVDEKRSQVSYMLSSIGPFQLIRNEVEKLKSNLSLEQKSNHDKIIRDEMNDDLLNYLYGLKQNTLSGSDLASVLKSIKERYNSDIEYIHDISLDEKRMIDFVCDRILIEDREQIAQKVNKYFEFQKALKELNIKNKSFEQIDKEALFEELLSAQNNQTIVTSKIENLQNTVLNNQKNIEVKESKLNAIENDIWKALKSSNVSTKISQINSILESYIYKTKINKIEKIEKHTQEMFGKLNRKNDFVKSIKLNETSITLTNQQGQVLQVNDLSSGEKQLLILSVIYAIVSVSERSIPLIFDTLLGRLDKNHQQQVFQSFIANCPDQVLILATDSELENISRKTLDSITNKKFKIDFSKANNKITDMSDQNEV